jgi:dipicolinate synthase subunit B
MSENACSTDTRFGKAADFVSEIEKITGKRVVRSITDSEHLGPKTPLEALVISPCTGNTLAKIASGITDTSVTMAAKAHLRCDRPLLIALASNDALSQNLSNIGRLVTRRSVFFVPLLQDDTERKPHSLVADIERIPECLAAALEARQIRPLFKEKRAE